MLICKSSMRLAENFMLVYSALISYYEQEFRRIFRAALEV